jgi:hypothetical protein
LGGLFAALCVLAPALADARGWSVSVYAGPGSDDYFTHIFGGGKFKVEGAVTAVALDGNLVNLGDGFMLIGEAQAVHYFYGPDTTALSLGLGLKYQFVPEPRMPVGIAFYMGPSYAIDPPFYTSGGTTKRYPWLNYVASEVTIGIPQWRHWDFVLRGYHRSGMYGMYAHDVDQGSMIGVGLRHRF